MKRVIRDKVRSLLGEVAISKIMPLCCGFGDVLRLADGARYSERLDGGQWSFHFDLKFRSAFPVDIYTSRPFVVKVDTKRKSRRFEFRYAESFSCTVMGWRLMSNGSYELQISGHRTRETVKPPTIRYSQKRKQKTKLRRVK